MSQTILISDDSTICDLLSLNLDTYLGTAVISRTNGEDAIDLLKILPSIDLIITKQRIGEENTAELLIEYIRSEQLQLEIIVMGSGNQHIKSQSLVIPDSSNWKEVIKSASKLIGVTVQGGLDDDFAAAEYVGIPCRYFLNINQAPCAVFIRIKKGEKDFQYVKIIHINDEYTDDFIHKYIRQGLDELFIPKDDHIVFTNLVSNQLVAKLEAKHINDKQRVEITSEGHDMAVDMLNRLGLSTATTQLVDATVDSMERTFATNSKSRLYSLFKFLMQSKGSYAYRHSHLTAIVASGVVHAAEWGSPEQEKKLAFVSFFHDIILEHEDLMKINSAKTLEQSKLPHKEKSKIFIHAQEASLLILEYPDLPFGADTIIRQHHGAINGQGFPDQLSTTLTPLATVFKLSEELSEEMIRWDEGDKEVNVPGMLDLMYKKYDSTLVRKVIDLLQTSLHA